MAYALALTGGSNVTIPSKSLGQNFEFWIDFEIDTYTSQTFLGRGTGSNTNQVYPIDATTIGWRQSTTANITLSEAIPLNTRHYLKFTRNNDATITIRNLADDVIGTLSTTVSLTDVTRIGLALGRAFSGKIYAMSITIDGVEQLYLNESDPEATTFGDGTLNGGTWEFYDDTPVATPISFTGTIPTQSFQVDEIVNVDLSSYFSGTETPFTYANTGTSLAGTGLTLSSAGVLSGTYAGVEVTGVVVTGTDTSTNTAASNSFNIATISSGTYNISVVDTLPALTDSMSMTFTPSGVGTITILDWANNTTTPLVDLSGITVDVYDITTGSLVYHTTSATVDSGSDCVVSDASIVPATDYKVTALKFNGTSYDIGIAIITAT